MRNLHYAKARNKYRNQQGQGELDLEWRYLLVEEEFYSQHARIEEVATSQLKMKRPTSQDEQVIIVK